MTTTQHHHRQRRGRGNKRRKGPRSLSIEGRQTDGSDRQSDLGEGNDAIEREIIAQLEVQRRKRTRQLSSQGESATTTTTIVPSPGARDEPSILDSNGSRTEAEGRPPLPPPTAPVRGGGRERSVVGKFRYDPSSGRYYPISALGTTYERDRDVRVRLIRGRISTTERERDGEERIVDATEYTSGGGPPRRRRRRRHGGIVSCGDVCRIAFRGTCPSTDTAFHNERWRSSSSSLSRDRGGEEPPANDDRASGPSPIPFPCSERTRLLLTTSLEYCATSTRRNAIVSTMLGPTSVARKANVTPASSTLETLRNETRMSARLHTDGRCDGRTMRPYYAWRVRASISIPPLPRPVDEWFSMLRPLGNSRGLRPDDCLCKNYLQPTAPTFDVIPSRGNGRSIELPHMATISNDGIYYRGERRGYLALRLKKQSAFEGVRLATNCLDYFVGCVVHDTLRDHHKFALRNLSTATASRENDDTEISTAAPVNDFCFAPHASWQSERDAPGNIHMAAFAHGGERIIGASFLDIATGSYIQIRDRWSKSETLCVRFRNDNESHHALFGHRDGGVSLLDTRSTKDALYLNPKNVSFGSVTSLQPLRRDANLVIGKGSFGACFIFDLRCMSSCNNLPRRKQSCLSEFSIPDHLIHRTRSVRCTGLAVDPSESIAIAPFIDQDDDVRFAIWNICNGGLIRTLRLNGVDACVTSGAGKKRTTPAFCELSRVITSGYGMSCALDSDSPTVTCEGHSWGVWYKSNNLINGTESPAEGGGIHHLSFR